MLKNVDTAYINKSILLFDNNLPCPGLRMSQMNQTSLTVFPVRVSQGSAVLRRCLTSSEGELLRLHRSFLRLLDDERNKSAAAQVDADVIRMRRQQVDKRAMPSFLQQGACRSLHSLSTEQRQQTCK